MIIKILFVGDHRDLGKEVHQMLLRNGYMVISASDNENALALLNSDIFNLILIDNALPEQRTAEILRFIRERNIPGKVIVLTGMSGLEAEVHSAVKAIRTPVEHSGSPVDFVKSIEHALSAEYHTALKLEIINARDFIKSTPKGDLDMTASVQILSQIATAGDLLGDFAVIIDLREVQSHLTTTDIYQLASDLMKYGGTFHRRTAVLTQTAKGQDQSNFFETAATNRGYNVKAFTHFENAINWLMRPDNQPEGAHK